MKLFNILKEKTLDQLKMDADYHTEFLSIDSVWEDGILYFLRYEEPYQSNSKAINFSNKIENFFNRKYGKMVVHHDDFGVIDGITNNNRNVIKKDMSVNTIKQCIKSTVQILNKLHKDEIISPEGSHPYETDFWLNKREKEEFMSGDNRYGIS